ncbi:16S rRNA (uracil1498-N3)-methyltransferase [Cetobacterium ceti]|uniref:Ribosomal RNA small subunit methyltransferase E n=1 Tax=Cetobacterium ceti TaxID=180163 RepID=A0A1T4NZ39_9FUSO|nr:16S rRNA (uracil(1498)-N(3))-methyltransferase [Cetobacterium ceti]SJZ84296.1 16S rRNA (uracil1498-N3)-methyltransferase [Cetobacterium ceti]
MISVIIPKENIVGEMVTISEKLDVNHLKNSFRLKVGDIFRAVDGEFEYICKATVVEKKEIVGEIVEKNEDRFSKKTKVHSAIGILKNDKMDLTIQKLTEIGVDKIIPLMTKRGVVKLSEKKDKWDLIAREAIKQCQAVKMMDIADTMKLKDIDFSQYDLVVVPYECEEDKTIKNLLNGLEEKPRKILYIVGPEGGFDPEEIEFLKEKGANIVTLGKRILRAETASIVVGGILVNEYE